MTRIVRLAAFASLAAALLQGCQSYEIVQTNVFADDDGNVITVDYGRSETDHVNTFRAPTNGKTMEFKSKLMVLVTLPDGDSFKAWRCMNLYSASGTTYKTDSERWMLLANGFSSVVYRRDDDDEGRYREVFRGVLCQVADREVRKDTRWKTIPTEQGTYKKNDESDQR